MRRWEIVILGIVAYGTILPALTGRRPRRGVVGAGLGLALLAQVVVEGARWPLVPLYAVAVAVAGADALNEERRLRGLLRVRQGAVGAALVAAGAAPAALLPVPSLPAPEGPFGVGTGVFRVVDPERPPVAGGPEGEGRVVPVRVWYPAAVPPAAEPEPWATGGVVGLAAGGAGAPGLLFAGAGSAPSHAVADAPPLSGRFPLVVAVHPAGGFAELSVDLLVGIASHGYVVAAADHPPVAALTRYPDGTTVPGVAPAVDDPAALEEAVATLAADVAAVLDAFGGEGPFGVLADHVDAAPVGLLGVGLGGGAAVRACLDDERCGVVAGLDPWVGPVPDRLVARELPGPAVFVRSGDPLPDEGRLRGLAERSPSVAYWVTVPALVGADFTALRTLTPLATRFGLRGRLDPATSGELVGREIVAVLDRHLAGLGGARLDEPPPPGVERETIR